jgi:hypothetical protein
MTYTCCRPSEFRLPTPGSAGLDRRKLQRAANWPASETLHRCRPSRLVPCTEGMRTRAVPSAEQADRGLAFRLVWLSMSETRKLAAILVSDIVGYSRLAGADEDRILAQLRTLRSEAGVESFKRTRAYWRRRGYRAKYWCQLMESVDYDVLRQRGTPRGLLCASDC